MNFAVGYVRNDQHDPGEMHVERVYRVDAAIKGVESLGLGSDLIVADTISVSLEDLYLVHPKEYIDKLTNVSTSGGAWADEYEETWIGESSTLAAMNAAGTSVEVMSILRESKAVNYGFSIIRPPGHHAGPRYPMGFCLLNNIGIVARKLSTLGEKVMIIDIDVHHGNGTQDIFWDDSNVVYLSIHQNGLYPGTGKLTEIGGENAILKTLNIPLEAGSAGNVFRMILESIISPTILRESPTWILVSAGFDSHFKDPLGGFELSSRDYFNFANELRQSAGRDTKILYVLEGGYDLCAIKDSTSASILGLLDGSFNLENETYSEAGTKDVKNAKSYFGF